MRNTCARVLVTKTWTSEERLRSTLTDKKAQHTHSNVGPNVVRLRTAVPLVPLGNIVNDTCCLKYMDVNRSILLTDTVGL